jgi:hypothetical protein
MKRKRKRNNTETFKYGDLTSIDINPSQKIIVAAVQDEDFYGEQ